MSHEHSNPRSFFFDVLVIGTGAAGLGVALSLNDHTQIAVISKDELNTGASPRAQGGISAALNGAKDIESHIQDTLIAGDGLCDEAAVRFTVENSKNAIQWLISHGVQFTKTPHQQFHLTQEGGHSQRRILHAADKTGDAVVSSLTQQIQHKKNISCFTQYTAIDLLTQDNCCIGVQMLDNKTGAINHFFARCVVLATGGASSVYRHTSNPDAATGDGIAMAWRAGCAINDMAFNQFHPTCLYTKTGDPFLLSEAIRGEGGFLCHANGERFMQHYDKRLELAPRDIVARAIDSEIKKHQLTHVYLDMRHFSKEKIAHHFPTIAAHCASVDINVATQLIPVVPAAHYTCGGIPTHLNGETRLKNLFAVGEVAHTGLHGANRMASNSLLECVVFAASAAQVIQKRLSQPSSSRNTNTRNILVKKEPLENAICEKLSLLVQETMSQHVGIVRSNHSLSEAATIIDTLNKKITLLWQMHTPTRKLIELRNMAQVSWIIVEDSIKRKASCGLHFNIDYPKNAAPTYN